MDVLFYAVPESNPSCHPTVFTDRFWDRIEGWTPTGVGTIPESFEIYRGPVPNGNFANPVGTPEEYINGLSYATFLAGGYANRGAACFDIPFDPDNTLQVGSGGMVYSGEADISSTKLFDGGGGLTLEGGGGIEPTPDSEGSGGLVFGIAGEVEPVVDLVGSEGLVLSGEGVIEPAVADTGSGNFSLGGEAEIDP